MKSYKLISLLVLALAFFSACESERDYPDNPLDKRNQVRFQATIGTVETRATGTEWETGDAIGVYALNGGTTLPDGLYDGKENIKFTTPGNGVFTAASTVISFPESGMLNFVAYYPYNETIEGLAYPIDISDQSLPSAIDLLYSDNAKGATISEPTVALQFKHKLSLLSLTITAGDGVGSLQGLSAKIDNMKTEGSLNLADGTVTPGSTSQSFTLQSSIADKTATAVAILLPGQGLQEATVTFSLGGQEYKWTPEQMDLESGKKYSYTIQLSTSGLTLLQPGATIEDWEDADTGSGIVVLTPEEDGSEEEYWTVSELRSKFTGSATTIADDVRVKAVVISNLAGGNSTSLKNLVVQDETGGISLRFTANNETLDFGDEVEISVKDQQLSEYNGLLQLNNIPNEKVVKIGAKSVAAAEITAAQLLSGDYESRYVAVKDVQVVAADLSKTLATESSHGSVGMESKNGETFVLFTSKYAAFKNDAVPQGSGTLKGIASVNNSTYQILPTVADDYAGMTGERFGDPGGGETPTGSGLFAGSDFEDWNVFVGALNSYGLKDYATQVEGGRNGSKALQIKGTPSGNDYVFTATVPQGFSAEGKTKIVFYIKGTSGKSLSLNVYNESAKYTAYNLGDYTEEKVVTSSANNQYAGTINTGGEWLKVTLDISGLTINSTAGEDLFALKVGKEVAYDLLVDDITIE